MKENELIHFCEKWIDAWYGKSLKFSLTQLGLC